MDKMNPNPTPMPSAVDPVCGMKVNPATARFKSQHAGENYFFCCAGCLDKFRANPEKTLSAPPRPMGSGLVMLGMPALAPSSGKAPSLSHPNVGVGGVASQSIPKAAQGAVVRDTRPYVCPMCPEVRQVGPGPCPKCGMALEPESPALPRDQDRIHLPDASGNRADRTRGLPDLRHGT